MEINEVKNHKPVFFFHKIMEKKRIEVLDINIE